jgi:formylglycine-generating enzyme required for sulfatase activity
VTALVAPEVDKRVPGYLGRVLNAHQKPAGTCFQVAPRILMTAWHVLETIGNADIGAIVKIDPLGGGAAITARVERADQPHDLAALVSARSLSPESARLAHSDQVPSHARTVITGVSRFDDRLEYRFLEAPGIWAGATSRGDGVQGSGIRLARVEARAVTPGMSGAPVRRTIDGAVVGMVSGRYTTPEMWLRDTVWVIRAEEMMLLLADVEVPYDDGSADPEKPEATPISAAEDFPAFLPVPPEGASFWLGRYLVTNSQFRRFLSAKENARWGPEHARGGADADDNYLRHWDGSAMPQALTNFPVVYVSLASARAYAAWLSQCLGSAVRLPMLSEWRIAAAAGRPGDWLGEELRAGRVNFQGAHARLTEVGDFGLNPYGFADLVGQACEMCVGASAEPVRCGGAFNVPRERLEETSEIPSPRECRGDTGFRCVLDTAPPREG